MGLIYIKTLNFFIISIIVISISQSAISKENFDIRIDENEIKKDKKEEEPSNSEGGSDDKKDKKKDPEEKKPTKDDTKEKSKPIVNIKKNDFELNTAKNRKIERTRENYKKSTKKKFTNTSLKVLTNKITQIKYETVANKDRLKVSVNERMPMLNLKKETLNLKKETLNLKESKINKNKNKKQQIISKTIQKNVKRKTNRIINKKPVRKPIRRKK